LAFVLEREMRRGGGREGGSEGRERYGTEAERAMKSYTRVQ